MCYVLSTGHTGNQVPGFHVGNLVLWLKSMVQSLVKFWPFLSTLFLAHEEFLVRSKPGWEGMSYGGPSLSP